MRSSGDFGVDADFEACISHPLTDEGISSGVLGRWDIDGTKRVTLTDS